MIPKTATAENERKWYSERTEAASVTANLGGSFSFHINSCFLKHILERHDFQQKTKLRTLKYVLQHGKWARKLNKGCKQDQLMMSKCSEHFTRYRSRRSTRRGTSFQATLLVRSNPAQPQLWRGSQIYFTGWFESPFPRFFSPSNRARKK